MAIKQLKQEMLQVWLTALLSDPRQIFQIQYGETT